MECLVLGLVLLAGPPAAGSPLPLSSIQEVAMDMAPNSFDDRYEGCSHLMERELPELNRTEFLTNNIYAKGWTEAAQAWQQSRMPQVPGLRPEHMVALMAYTMDGPLYKEFNEAVREAGRSQHQYLHGFPFKVLHFLLSQALSTLQRAQGRCHHVYRGVRDMRFTARRGQSVRFGQFTSSSLHNSSFIYDTFGRNTIFTVHTCWGALIRDFSSYPAEEEILIPPSEVFEVTSSVLTGDSSSIELRSQGISSTYNCELLKGNRSGAAPCPSCEAQPLLGLLLAALAAAGRL